MKVCKLLLDVKNSLFDNYFEGKVMQIKKVITNDSIFKQKKQID